ncbi:hypothetical protein [Halobacillus naozhouensis]|uniref:Uncharacterized protein n=1 Tax=Halobacillus naozhouensis TaxID=554880 RepID=A0ABY8J6M0_9BACI|nr:hypothetical protein [Halobacillus naozhouensis]WFT76415.1 hypothetical protein P9989_08650 [Halobacillus naozhouensis]
MSDFILIFLLTLVSVFVIHFFYHRLVINRGRMLTKNSAVVLLIQSLVITILLEWM